MNVTETRKLIESLLASGNLTDETFAGALKLMGHKIPRQTYYTPVPKSDIDPATIDWDKPNNMLSAELNIPAINISKLRHKFGRRKLFNAKTAHVNWRQLDWTKNNQELSRELGISITSIVKQRLRLGHAQPINPQKNRAVTQEMIEAVDWSICHDSHLAKQWGITRERVRQIRQQNQKPKCQLNTCDSLTMEFEKWLLDNESTVTGMLAAEVANMSPSTLNKSRKFYVMKRTRIPFIFKRFREHSSINLPINWYLPNVFIESIWNKSHNWAASTRNRFSLPKAEFTHHKNLDQDGSHLFDMESLYPLISDDIEKVTKLGIKPNMERLKKYGYVVTVEQEQTV